MTPSEKLLWQEVRGDKLGVRVSRQKIVFDYVADFYCAAASLVIELDGRFHEERKDRDAIRDENLARAGITTIRIPSAEGTP
jgi:Uncharacterized protein conserved in bacteria